MGTGRVRLVIPDANGAVIKGEMASDLLVLQRFSCVERVTGIEPALSAWETCLRSRSVLLGPSATW